MRDDHPINNESRRSLTDRAVEKLNSSINGIKAWTEKVRGDYGRTCVNLMSSGKRS